MKEELRDIVMEVNRTLENYESGYTSTKMWEGSEPERCNEFRRYIELRFNRACEFYLPEEFQVLFPALDGFLFSCVLEEPLEKARRFKKAKMTLRGDFSAEMLKTLLEYDESLINRKITELETWIGGNVIEFTHQRKKFSINIYNK